MAESVASVRPWKLPSMTTTVGTATPRRRPCRRASLIAASLASAPELQKKAASIPASAHSRPASVSCSGMR